MTSKRQKITRGLKRQKGRKNQRKVETAKRKRLSH